MSPEEVTDSATRVLALLLEGARQSSQERGYDATSIQKLILGIEHIDSIMNPAALQNIIERAKRDVEMDAVLCGWGAKFIANDTDMPLPLREYIAQKLESFSHSRSQKRGKRGRHPRSNFLRDFAVTYVIARIVCGVEYSN